MRNGTCPQAFTSLLIIFMCSLRNLAIVQPDEIKGEELIKALSRPFPILRELAITFPWRDYTYPPEQAGAGAKLAGVVAQVLPSCKSIKKLHCQDHDFQLDAVLDLPNLEELIVTVDRPETFNAYMEHEVRRSEISFLVDVRGPQVANCLAVKQLMKDWGPRGVKIGIAWPVGVHTRPLTAFAARLPDPVIGVSRHELLRTALRLYKDLRAPLKHQQVLV